MSLVRLPEIQADARMSAGGYDLRQDIMARWSPEVRMAADAGNEAQTISIYDQIGETWDGNGWTAARVSGILRNVGASTPITVNLNTPGGDFFEGVAIFNLLKLHKAEVTINVMGMAASAGSVIAMAGDTINMGEGSFLMIHCAWCLAGGNASDLRTLADTLSQFDTAMADLYAARSGKTQAQALAMMQAETWIGAQQAIKEGFAHSIIDAAKASTQDAGNKKAKALVEASMARAGHSKEVRAETMAQLFVAPPVDDPQRSDPQQEPGDNPNAAAEMSELSALLRQLSAGIAA